MRSRKTINPFPLYELCDKVKILYKEIRQKSTQKGYILGTWLLGQQVLRVGITDVLGIMNIANIADVADIATGIADIGTDIADIGTDIANIGMDIADIADWIL